MFVRTNLSDCEACQAAAAEVRDEFGQIDVLVTAATWTPATEEWFKREGDAVAAEYPLGRVGVSEDPTNAAVFLASDGADWITGQSVPISGGRM